MANANNTKHITVYKASAGSGKTFTLASNYLSLLLDPKVETNEFKHILAVTFTVKATGEMKDRILGSLYNIAEIERKHLSIAAIPNGTKAYIDKIAELQEVQHPDEKWIRALSRKADDVLREILHNYDRFRVSTIDSFFQSVLRGVAHELRLPADLRTEINHDEVRRLAVERLMENLDNDKEAHQLVWQFVEDKIENDSSWQVNNLLYDFSSWIFDENYAEHRTVLKEAMTKNPQLLNDLRNDLTSEKTTAEKDAQDLWNNIQTEIASWDIDRNQFKLKGDRTSLLSKIEKSLAPIKDFKAIKEDAKLFAVLDSDPYDDNESYSAMVQKKDITPQQTDLARKALDYLKKTIKTYDQILNRYTSAILALEHLHQLGLIELIDSKVQEINDENGQFVLANTGSLLSELMGTEGNTEFVFEKIGPMLHQIMIDEFQDTSRLQWNNFLPLVQELMSSNKGHLIVGDVKQSIYRWRSGDWTILGQIDKQGVLASSIQVESLQQNFRSDGVIINFNNSLFPSLAQKLDQLAGFDDNLIADAYKDVHQDLPSFKEDKKDQGFVRARIYKSTKEPLANIISDLGDQIVCLHGKGVPYGKMAILVRNSTHVLEMKQLLQSHPDLKDVNIVPEKSLTLNSSWAITILIAALRYMHNPDDKLSQTLLERHYRESFPEEIKTLPLLELNERLIELMGLNKHEGQSEFLMTYLDFVAQWSKSNPADLGSFLEYWDDRLSGEPISALDPNAIPIVTIHKSKGLAYDYVFMPDCDFSFHKSTFTNLQWIPTEGLPAPYNKVPVLPIDLNKSATEKSIFSSFRKKDIRMELMDAINLLYVGFTRAKKELYFWGRANKELTITASAITALRDVMPQTVNTDSQDGYTTYLYGTQTTQYKAKTNEAESRLEPLFDKPIPCAINPIIYQPKFQQSSESRRLTGLASEQAKGNVIVEGNKFHSIFSLIKVADDLDQAIATYRNREGLDETTEQRFRKFFAQGLQQEKIADWFSDNYAVFNEKTLIAPNKPENMDTHTPRPDRVMVNDQKVIVVDFKLTSQNHMTHKSEIHKKYQQQVRNYMTLLHQMMPTRTIEGYLWYLLDNTIETIELE